MSGFRTIAYFSMEIGLEPGMPTYSGGLGVLAGDTIRAAADLEVPMVAVTILHRHGYFYQRLDAHGEQVEEPVDWVVDDFLVEAPGRVSVRLEDRDVRLRAWKYEVRGVTGFKVPVYFLDADLPENADWDRSLTGVLYGGDSRYRLCQEVLLGIGGVRLLRALGFQDIERFHMNEGHASLLTLALLDEEARRGQRSVLAPADVDAVRGKCIFTTHTPVPAGQDQFPLEMVRHVLGALQILDLEPSLATAGVLNMTHLALHLSQYVNGVAKKHGETARLMFAPYRIDSITNGVHAGTWTSAPFQELFDRHIPGWREDNLSLRYALNLPKPEVWQAHTAAKRRLIQYANRETNAGMDLHVFTIGFARRAAAYKRADLLFHDVDRLKAIAAGAGPFQLVFAGKAHPQDEAGKEIIRRIFRFKEVLRREIKIAYLENYDFDLGKLMTGGVDLWLNTPQPPYEASGTSGMKAALNGVPSLSVLDGWWIEGHIEGKTGWAIGTDGRGAPTPGDDGTADAVALYEQLERVILPLYYRDQDRYLDVMLHCIALNGSFFNTKRMMLQYVFKAYHAGLIRI